MLDVCCAVAVLHSPGQNPEALSSDGVYDGSTVGKEMDAPDDQHAAVVYEARARQHEIHSNTSGLLFLRLFERSCCRGPVNLPFLRIINAHAKLPGARFHAPANHEAVAWLEDMQRTRHGGVRHGAHKDRHILCQTVEKETCLFRFSNLLTLHECGRLRALLGELSRLIHVGFCPLRILLTQILLDECIQEGCHRVLSAC